MLFYSWKILLAGVLLVSGCQADTIERYPYHSHHDDDDDDGIDLDWDFDGDVDLDADADLDFGVDVDVDVDADFDIASRIGDAFDRVTDRVTDATRGTITISNDPHRNSSYSTHPNDRPTRRLRPVRTTRPTTQPSRTTDPAAQPTRSPRATTDNTRRPDRVRDRNNDRNSSRDRDTDRDRSRSRDRDRQRDRDRDSNNTNSSSNNTNSSSNNTNSSNDNGNNARSGSSNDNGNNARSGSGNDNGSDARSGSGNDNGNSAQPISVEVGELFHLSSSGVGTTVAVQDKYGVALQRVLLRLGSGSLRKLFLTRALAEHYLIVHSSNGKRRIPLTGKESSIDWTLEHSDTKVTLNIEGGLVPDHLSANIAVKLHLLTARGTGLASTTRTANIALRNGRGSVTFILRGSDAKLNFNNGCYRWVVESLSSSRVMFGAEFGGRCG